MKQKYAVLVLFALIGVSALTSFSSYRATEQLVTEDMGHALAQALEAQQSDVISQDTIRIFNSYLRTEQLRGRATLAVSTRQRDFVCYAQCSRATIFALSEQRPAMVLWLLTLLWMGYCVWRRRPVLPVGMMEFGGLRFSETERLFFAADGSQVKLTPMQQQLMEMFFRAPSHRLTKTEICDALWPKKDDANETLYTLIRRLKPVIEAHSSLQIESDRSRAYGLTVRCQTNVR